MKQVKRDGPLTKAVIASDLKLMAVEKVLAALAVYRLLTPSDTEIDMMADLHRMGKVGLLCSRSCACLTSLAVYSMP
jgi:hypothetical protein